MQTLWFILIAFMLTMYILLDGFDLGAGVIHLFAARTESEREQVLRAIGPVWDGNEVWLIAAGGTLFFSFPILYASSFSGFYLPLIIVLWLLIVRGVAIELRSHISNPVWIAFWDGGFFIGSALLAIFFGAAMGNVIRGVPMDAHGVFFEALWTDFNPFSAVTGILDWYTVLIGLFALVVLTTHGATFIAVKTESMLQQRARRIAKATWLISIIMAIVVTVVTIIVQPLISENFGGRYWIVIFPLIALIGWAGIGLGLFKGRDRLAFFSSCAFIIGMLASTAASLYPYMLPATTRANSLTIHNAAASAYGQTVGLVWWIIGIVLASIYFIFTYRLFWGKVPTGTTIGGGYGDYAQHKLGQSRASATRPR
ncbi:cytochrome d ubiquinol oxidase subunit II [Dictyobacter aurantiacus]|uniref:Cytochrome oxidase d subunit II n=1 Tax=Dictyobacter aurantiacus TaxID=1936993 RepID=A0A401ZI36_9CHLR|nr:cytochrome d ubiquinol oxidase subunit II [Dictyobacter aurantiacus]GCE06505.1 cytochrome oxidase d subunit II [Dictyobacter aurantiacus]